MSFWASSYSFQLEQFFAAYCLLFKVVLSRVSFYDDCKETRAMFPRLVNLLNLFDAMLGRVLARPNRGPNCSMKLPTAQEQ